MKKEKIIFWITTILIVLWEGVMPAVFGQTEMAKEGLRHLQYPEYFGFMLLGFKVLGAIALLIPSTHWIKEWAYAGFAFDFVAASVSHGAIDGWGNGQTYMPYIFLAILLVSHYYYRRIWVNRPAVAVG